MPLDPLILARGLHLVCSLLAGGTVAFLVLVAEPAARATNEPSVAPAALRRRLNELVWFALSGAMASGALWLALLAANILGTNVVDAVVHGGAWTVLSETRFGAVWALRAALVVLIAGLLPSPRLGWLQLGAAAGLVATLAWVGHAGATPGAEGDVHLIADVLHLLAAGAWLGGLPALALLLSRAPRAGDPGFAVRATARFSWLGMVGVGTLLASGVINSWFALDGIGDLIATDYGRLLLVKFALFVGMIVVAAVNRFRLTPKLPALQAMRALMRNSLIENALGLGVLLIVGVLGTMPPAAHRHAPPPAIPADAAFVHIHSSEAMADVTIDPGRAGRTHVTIRVSREDFSEFPARSVRLALDQPKPAHGSVECSAIAMPDGTWQVNALDLGTPGIWTIRVIVIPMSGPSIVLDAPVEIAR
ncbi:MAG TPA: copper homeostasis membrane protein CopD [Pseudolabrys sp.]|nr:copper homeostasis membrane protein CopD [Pseudolabrys sp.]